jgi:hypothetical protein
MFLFKDFQKIIDYAYLTGCGEWGGQAGCGVRSPELEVKTKKMKKMCINFSTNLKGQCH